MSNKGRGQSEETRSPPPQLNMRDAAVGSLTFLALLALALLAWQWAPLLLLIFGGVLVANFLRSLADWIARWTGLSHGWSLSVAMVMLFVLGALGLFLGGQRIANQMADLAEQFPKSLEKLRAEIIQYSWGRWVIKSLPSSVEEISVGQTEAAAYATTALSSFSGILGGLLIVLFLAIYFAIDPGLYVRGLILLVPVAKRGHFRKVLGEIDRTLRWWLLGKLLSMMIVGIFTTIGLMLLGIPLAGALGVIAALLTFVPNFGPIISAVPAVLLAFVESPTTAAYVVVLYLAIQTIESYLITPLIQQRTVSAGWHVQS